MGAKKSKFGIEPRRRREYKGARSRRIDAGKLVERERERVNESVACHHVSRSEPN